MIQIIASCIFFTCFTFLPTFVMAAVNPVLSQGEPKDTLVIQNDTLVIMGSEYSKGIAEISKCTGEINGIDIYFIGRTKENSEYSYCIGSDPSRTKHFEKYDSPQLSILLLKKDSVTSNINFNQHFSLVYNMNLNNLTNVKLLYTDEVIELRMFQEFCGGYHGSVLFARRKNTLIKGVSIEQYGEPDTEYFTQEVIQSKNGDLNELWIENEVGKNNIVYFTEIEKYKIQNDSLIRINPKRENIYYVTSKNGLMQRAEPSVSGESLGSLPYKTKVNVLNKTDIGMTLNDGGKQIKGHWVQIEYDGEQLYDNSFFVFDGYLSKNEPEN